VDDETLMADPLIWLGDQLYGLRRRAQLESLDLGEALLGRLDWNRRSDLDRLAPTHLPVPSGRRIVIDYSGPEPVLAVKLQEMFGATVTPTVVDGRQPLLLHLLSPAGRPVQVTRDLVSFWNQGYTTVRAELRGRYPKHPWPENPWEAPAQAGVKHPRRR
jgi:ATP-dependent helicase HrpB